LVSLAARVTDGRAPLLAMAGARDLPRRVAAVLDRSQRRGRAGSLWTTATLVAGLGFSGMIAPLCAAWQSAESPRVSFEVASVKENTSGDPFGGGAQQMIRLYPGGRFVAHNASLRELILVAYRDEISPSQLAGVAGWMTQRRFDVEARAANGAIAPGELDYVRAIQIDRMLQALLADRFKLRVRREQQPGDVHVLSVAPGGPKLTPARTAEACLTGTNPGGLTIRNESLSPCHVFSRIGRTGLEGLAVDSNDLVMALRLYLRGPVVDHAGLTQLSDVSVHWNPDPLRQPDHAGGAVAGEPQPSEDDPDIYTAFRDQLGMKLEIVKAPVETLVVESAEPPASN
jgi:uncharacterized protein (TIGR03435 family)